MAEAVTDWRQVWLLWAAGLGAAGQWAKISVTFDMLPGIYPGTGAGALGLAVSLVGFIGILLGVVAGVAVARVGFRRAILWALWLGAALSALQALWPPLWLFMASRVVEGIAHLAIVVAAPTLIAQVSGPRQRGLALTLWSTFFGVAFALLVWVGRPLAEAAGPGALLIAHAAWMAAMALILAPRLPVLVARPQAVSLREALAAHRRLYSSARIGAPALGWLFYTLCFVSVLTVLPPYLPQTERVFTIGAMPLLSILTSLTFGVWLMRRIGPVAVIVTGFALCALAAAWLGLAPGMAPALAVGAALGLVQGASFAAVGALNDLAEDRALANGGLAQMGNLGNTCGTPLMLGMISAAGFAGLVWALALFFLAGAMVHLILARARITAD